MKYFDRYDQFGTNHTIMPRLGKEPPHISFIDIDQDASAERQASRVIEVETLEDIKRERILTAAVGVLKELVSDGEKGMNPGAVIRAASHDLIISHLVTNIKILIDASGLSQNSPQVQNALSAIRLAEAA